MRFAPCILCLLALTTGAAGAPRAESIPGGTIVVASARDDLDLVARPLAGGVERVLLAGLDSPHSPAVSPDGRTVVYASQVLGRTDLFALDLDSGARRALTNDTRYESAPAFSPDGSELAYVSSRACGQRDRDCVTLKVLSVAERRSRVLLTGLGLNGPAWSPDGRRIAFTRDHAVWVVGSEGATPRRVATGNFSGPSWSPDGMRIVVEEPSVSIKSSPDLWIVDVATTRVSSMLVSGAAPVWLASGRIRFLGAGADLFDVNPDGTGRSRVTRGGGLSADWAAFAEEVIYTRNVGGHSMLYELGDDGRASRRLSERGAILPSLSPDGRSIAFVAPSARPTGVYVLPAGGGAVRKVATTPREIQSKPSWSPDGKRIAFEVRGGIATVAATGGVVRHVRGTVRNDESPAWAPDGREIAFARFRRATDLAYRDSHDVWAANVRTGRARIVIRDGWEPAWSPDGRRIAFASDRTTFSTAIWTARRDGTARKRLTGGQVSHLDPAWSPDGRHLAFLRSDDGPTLYDPGLWLIPAGGGAARRLPTEVASFTWGRRGG
jgi:Tol biopolymer transport system component